MPSAMRCPCALPITTPATCSTRRASARNPAPCWTHSQLELLEIPEAAICCGSAGIYNLVQPKAAAQLGDRKAGYVAALNADVVVSGNPGCLLQLQSALARTGRKMPVRHIVELLDASIRGVSL